MAHASPAQTSFIGGERSNWAQGQFDRPDYRTALNVCFNSMPLEQGPWTRRPGTRVIQNMRYGEKGRILRFDFKQSQPYGVLATRGILRFIAGTTPVTTNDDQVVTSISSANPAVVTTQTAHGWTSGEFVLFDNMQTYTPLLQGRVFSITVTGSQTFTLADEITLNPFDGTSLGQLRAGTKVKRILQVFSPYTGFLWNDIKLVQAEMQAVLLHPTIAPYVLTATPPAAGQTFYTFSLSKANLIDGPYLDPPTNGAVVTPSATNGVVTVTLSAPTWQSGKAYSIGDFVTYSSVTYISIVDQNQGNTPNANPSKWSVSNAGKMIGATGFVGTDINRLMRIKDSAGNWTYGKITALQNLIDPALAGSTQLGDLVASGGLAAAFDTVLQKSSGACAVGTASNTGTGYGYVGKDYSGASAKAIAFATIWPSSDLGFDYPTMTYITYTTNYQANLIGPKLGQWSITGTSSQSYTVQISALSLTINLRASNSSPGNHADGTLLGSQVWFGGPLTITSNDQTTSWKYVWIELVATGFNISVPPDVDTRSPVPPTVAQATAGATAYSQTSTLQSYAVQFMVSQVQFFLPSGSGGGNAVNLQILGTALADTTTRDVWQLGAYSDTTGWPTCGTYHEGRLWLAGAIDNRMDGSRVGNPFNFAGSETSGTVTDADAIAAILDGPDTNSIFWMTPDQLGIIVGTQAGEWLVQASANNNVLTPASFQAHRYDRLGCANIEPRRASGPLIVVKRYAKKLLEYFADVISGKFTAHNLLWQAQHITNRGKEIVEIAYQAEVTPTIWGRCADGSMFGVTYKRESLLSSQPPEICGVHRHALGSGRSVISMSAAPSVNGDIDTLGLVTKDTTGLCQVEFLMPLFEEGLPLTEAWFLDSAVAASSYTVSRTAVTANGLWLLNGRTVTVFAGGLDCGEWLVSNGSIVMTYGDGVSAGAGGGLFTQAFANSFNGGMQIVAGFTYNSDGQMVRPQTAQDSGARSGPALGKKRRVHQVAAMVENAVGGQVPELGTAAGLQFGTDFDHLKPALFRDDTDAVALAYGTPFTGILWDSLDDTSSYDGMVCWRITRPWPCTIVAIEPFLQTMDG